MSPEQQVALADGRSGGIDDNEGRNVRLGYTPDLQIVVRRSVIQRPRLVAALSVQALWMRT